MELANAVYTNAQGVADFTGKLVENPINFSVFGLNMAQVPTFAFNLLILIPLVSAVTAFFSMQITNRANAMITGQAQQKQSIMTMLLGPGMSLIFGFMMPAGISIYWITQNLLRIAQEMALVPYFRKLYEKKEKERQERERKRQLRLERQKEEKRRQREEALRNKTKGKKFTVAKNASLIISETKQLKNKDGEESDAPAVEANEEETDA